LAEARVFFLFGSVQTGFKAYPISSSTVNVEAFLLGKAAGACS
jgi:hypothetical protein